MAQDPAEADEESRNAQSASEGSGQSPMKSKVGRAARGASRGVGRLLAMQQRKEDLEHEEEMNFTELMETWPLFAKAVPGLVPALAQHIQPRTVNPGATIAVRGGANTSLLFVVAGLVDISVGTESIGSLSSGTYIGETNFLGIENSWTVALTAHGFCTIGRISRETVVQLSESWPDVAIWLQSFIQLSNATLAGGEQSAGGVLVKSFRPFQSLPKAVALAIESTMTTRVYFPGEMLLTEGASGDELCILVKGSASVRKGNGEKMLHQFDSDSNGESIILGELGLIGFEPVRTASIRIESVSLVRVLYRSVFVQCLEERGEALRFNDVEALIESRYKNNHSYIPKQLAFSQDNVFKLAGCGASFLEYLAENLQRRIYIVGQKIINESSTDRSMYVVASGMASIMKNGTNIATLKAGSAFGEQFLLGTVTRRSADVIASATSIVEILDEKTFHAAVQLYPGQRGNIFKAAFKQVGITDDCSFDHDSRSPSAPNEDRFLEGLRKAPFFSQMELQLVRKLSTLSIQCIFLPGELIIEEGSKGDSMFVLVTGNADVYKQYKEETQKLLQSLSAGNLFGELAMLGVAPSRRASIVAVTMCSMWEIKQGPVMSFLSDHPSARPEFLNIIKDNLERTVTERIDKMALFSDFEPHFRLLLSISCSRRVYLPGDKIVSDTQQMDGMMFLNIGKAALDKKAVRLVTYSAGSHFGSTVMLGVRKALPGAVCAIQVCHVLVITRANYEDALAAHPSPEAAKALVMSELAAANESQKEARRREHVLHNAADGMAFQSLGLHNPTKHVPPVETLGTFFQAWRNISRDQSMIRKQRKRRNQEVKAWVSRAESARQRKAVKEQLATTSQPFTWIRRPAWDNGDGGKKTRFPLIASTAWLTSPRGFDAVLPGAAEVSPTSRLSLLPPLLQPKT